MAGFQTECFEVIFLSWENIPYVASRTGRDETELMEMMRQSYAVGHALAVLCWKTAKLN